MSQDTLYDRIGGRAPTLALAERFYDVMEATEPALTATHPLDDRGRIARSARERFGLFLVGWLGGPRDYMRLHGHPRLRMRHVHVPIDTAMRDAWMRCMVEAMRQQELPEPVQAYLTERFGQVADFMRNTPDAPSNAETP